MMKVKLPKHMRGVANTAVLAINLKNFDIDYLLPALFFIVWANGSPMGRRLNDATLIQSSIDKLAQHPDLIGFEGDGAQRMLIRLTRSSLIILGRKGRSHAIEQIAAIQPYSLLSSKAGFPQESARLNNVETFIYQALYNAIPGLDRERAKTLRDHFIQVFSKGTQLDQFPVLNGRFDGSSQLDMLTRLSLAYLDGFIPTPIGAKRSTRHEQLTSCPALTSLLGGDLLRYIFAYSGAMPPTALTFHLQALISFELFIYTTKVAHAINQLVDTPNHLPEAMQEQPEASAPEIYLDFTGSRTGLSYSMANDCVRRDVETYQRFVASNILLKQLQGYAIELRRTPSRAARIAEILGGATDGTRYLKGLLLLMQDDEIGPQIQHLATGDEDAIRREYQQEDGSEDSADLERLEEIARGSDSPLGRLIAILTHAQSDKATDNYMQWFSTIGGLRKSYGILASNTSSRTSWRYAPDNEILAVLVQMAAIEKESDGHADSAKAGQWSHPQAIRLREFLDYLERRFGILIDRPPSSYSGAEASAAARENLRAMLDRLRQMGIFSDMSDDFTVQRLQPPYAESRPTNLLSQRS
jgi:hypothetical protein